MKPNDSCIGCNAPGPRVLCDKCKIETLERKLALAKEALEEMLKSHYYLYLYAFPMGQPEDDLVRIKARAVLEKLK